MTRTGKPAGENRHHGAGQLLRRRRLRLPLRADDHHGAVLGQRQQDPDPARTRASRRKWYTALFEDEKMVNAIEYSLKVAFVAVLISACAALFLSLILHRMKLRGGAVIQALLASPLVAPGLVLGISLLVIFHAAKIEPGFWTIIAGHVSFITPLIMFILLQRLKTSDPSLEQASMDCGAGSMRTFWHVTLPGRAGGAGRRLPARVHALDGRDRGHLLPRRDRTDAPRLRLGPAALRLHPRGQRRLHPDRRRLAAADRHRRRAALLLRAAQPPPRGTAAPGPVLRGARTDRELAPGIPSDSAIQGA